jgi:hypothetical protein
LENFEILFNQRRRIMKAVSKLNAIICSMAVICICQAAMAEDSPQRILGKHAFIPSDVVSDPFTGTYFSFSTGIGIGSMDLAVDVPLEGDMTIPADLYKMVVLGEKLDLQLSILDWLAIRGGLEGLVLSGADLGSALNMGAVVNYNWGAGAVVRVFRSEKLQLSASFDFVQDNSLEIKPATFLDSSITQGNIATDKLLTKVKGFGFKGGAQAAFAINDSFGIWANAEFQHLRKDDLGDNAIIAGSGLSLDLYPSVSVPLGLIGYYQMEQGFEEGDKPEHQFGGGLFITGRENLSLGLEAAVQMSEQNDIMKTFALIAAFKMRYYW